jgi:F420-dependent methylenetetrahydromethanopterin dehydrogenase
VLLQVRRLLVTASVVPSSPILVALTMKALNSSEVSVLRITTRRDIPEDAIRRGRRENLKSYREGMFVFVRPVVAIPSPVAPREMVP